MGSVAVKGKVVGAERVAEGVALWFDARRFQFVAAERLHFRVWKNRALFPEFRQPCLQVCGNVERATGSCLRDLRPEADHFFFEKDILVGELLVARFRAPRPSESHYGEIGEVACGGHDEQPAEFVRRVVFWRGGAELPEVRLDFRFVLRDEPLFSGEAHQRGKCADEIVLRAVVKFRALHKAHILVRRNRIDVALAERRLPNIPVVSERLVVAVAQFSFDALLVEEVEHFAEGFRVPVGVFVELQVELGGHMHRRFAEPALAFGEVENVLSAESCGGSVAFEQASHDAFRFGERHRFIAIVPAEALLTDAP